MESGPPFVGVGGAPVSLGLGGFFSISFLFPLHSLLGCPITQSLEGTNPTEERETMTHEARYSIRGTNGNNADDLTLYEAAKALITARNEGATTDASHISRNGRPVAFFSEWLKVVRPMWKALPQEADVLMMWEMS